jgi:hypothetical protein
MLHENGRVVIGVLRKCHYPPHGDFERIVQVHGDLKAFASVFKESSWVELIVSVIINFDASTPGPGELLNPDERWPRRRCLLGEKKRRSSRWLSHMNLPCQSDAHNHHRCFVGLLADKPVFRI